MPHKKYLLIILGISFFGAAFALGYFMPNAGRDETTQNSAVQEDALLEAPPESSISVVVEEPAPTLAKDALNPEYGPSIPGMTDKTFGVFMRQFGKARAALEPMLLPKEPVLSPYGQSVSLADFEGEPMLVNFWATWCAPCVVELPSLDRFAAHYQGRLRVVAVALEPTKTPNDIADFLKKRGIGEFAGYFDENGTFMRELAIRGLPTSFLIGKDGHILYRFEGAADWTSAATKEFFDVYLAGSGQPNQ